MSRSKFFLVAALLFSSACTGGNKSNRLLFPSIITIDQAQERIFIVDNQRNGLNLVDARDNKLVVDGDDNDTNSLLEEEDPLLLPAFPSAATVVDLDNGVSRLFVLGSDRAPLNTVTVLDYDPSQGIRQASISPIIVSGNAQDLLTAIVYDEKRNQIWVANSTAGTLSAFNVSTGAEAGEPIALDSGIAALNLDAAGDRLVVGNGVATQVSWIDLAQGNGAPTAFDVGILVRDVAMFHRGAETFLAVTGAQENVLRIFRLNLGNPENSELVYELLPPLPGEPDPEILTGNLNRLVAGTLSNGNLACFVTQSSGDLLSVQSPSGGLNFIPKNIEIGAVSGEGIAATRSAAGELKTIYFVTPGLGNLSIVDPVKEDLEDQIN